MNQHLTMTAIDSPVIHIESCRHWRVTWWDLTYKNQHPRWRIASLKRTHSIKLVLMMNNRNLQPSNIMKWNRETSSTKIVHVSPVKWTQECRINACIFLTSTQNALFAFLFLLPGSLFLPSTLHHHSMSFHSLLLREECNCTGTQSGFSFTLSIG